MIKLINGGVFLFGGVVLMSAEEVEREGLAGVNERLRAAGIPESAIARVHAPIGTAIRAVTPAEIAVSVAAEMIRHRALRAGTDKKPSKG